MKIILNEDVEKLGEKGELKQVKEGYARNFLFPKNLAIPATKSAIKMINDELKSKEAENSKLKEEAQAQAKILEGQKITIPAKTEKNGKLFGAISEKEIAKNIKKQINLDVNPKNIEITEPIKEIGDYKIKINLHKEIKLSIDVKIVTQK